MGRTKLQLSLIFLFLILTAVVSWGQTGTGGTIIGTVTDPSGAAIPNVAITVTNTDTSDARHTNTNSVGQYIVPDLPVGHYTVRAESSGFKASEQSNLTLNVGDRTRVDFPMQIGNAQESVTVQAEAIQVQSDSSEVSDLITGKQVTQLATNGRSIYSLTALMPGASGNQADFQAPTAVSGDNNVSFNGMRKSSTLYLVDGGEDLDRGGSGNISILPSIDAISEFRALTSNYSSEFGLASGATFTMVFKSGTRDLHASAWEFVRNNDFDANNFFNNKAGQPPPELRSNTYGFNVGGPVLIPKLYNKTKDKTFFFYNMEWRKLIQGQTLNTTVPLSSSYGGVFPSVQIQDPNNPCKTKGVVCVPNASVLSPALQQKFLAAGLTFGKQFPNNTIPASLLDPNAQLLLKAGIFPAPTSGTQFVGGNSPKTDVREEIVRIDHRFNDKFWIFGHYVAEQVSQGFGTTQWSGVNVPTIADTFGNPAYSGVVHATYSISPTLLNETAFNYDGNRINIIPTGVVSQPSG
ncbi:MAG: carboxypeptidase regulatory-like domain-containing protein, partial [Acidobacteriaceae bacterium]|nr:carboxypeptidase regulatory-like domain-containing protein [Acidobacteriaceae bacterium]